MKTWKKVGIGFLLLPYVLATLIFLYELIGMGVNHASTDKQTGVLRDALSGSVNDIEILNVNSWTGNTGNGNHVECVSEITFSSAMEERDMVSAISDKMGKESYLGANGCYFIDCEENGSVRFSKNDDGNYLCRMVKSAPFSDNIEGH
ncbi:MAG: hypothetical protein J5582_08225 [Ruminococcus sp.]|uniref:Uncharacterized protein n=1 Tax=Ruminococcus albus TaxID=1264 RepID=A0A1H7FE62_RUMAL|nr:MULTISPECIES: hypothetical protein [Ruminococcus]MBO4866543.1 hypothetical protein [Ruminococcus sp.]SEK21535.1 hypothetical protein SAMN05216469_101126 [Ruminococcus albus]